MKILVADDHIVLRKGLVQILAEAFPEAEFGETGDTTETLEWLERRSWDLLVLDIFMPGRGGLEVLREARQRHSRVPVLVLSSAPEEQMAVRVLKAGAAGYLNKQTAPEELVVATQKLLAGGRYVSRATAERLAAEVAEGAGKNRPPHETLSDREFEVFRLLISGRSLKEIAAELSLSAKTISTFHTRIWEKLRVQNDIEMVRYALDHGLTGKP